MFYFFRFVTPHCLSTAFANFQSQGNISGWPALIRNGSNDDVEDLHELDAVLVHFNGDAINIDTTEPYRENIPVRNAAVLENSFPRSQSNGESDDIRTQSSGVWTGSTESLIDHILEARTPTPPPTNEAMHFYEPPASPTLAETMVRMIFF